MVTVPKNRRKSNQYSYKIVKNGTLERLGEILEAGRLQYLENVVPAYAFWMPFGAVWVIFVAIWVPGGCPSGRQNRTFRNHVRTNVPKMSSKNNVQKHMKKRQNVDAKMGGCGMQKPRFRSILVSK